jgi:hypothetical protein
VGQGGGEGGTVDPDKVIDALPGIKAPNLTGGVSEMLPNHHITKPVLIGEIKGDGQFDVVWKSEGLIPGDAWSKELEGSKDLVADWVGRNAATSTPRPANAAARAASVTAPAGVVPAGARQRGGEGDPAQRRRRAATP